MMAAGQDSSSTKAWKPGVPSPLAHARGRTAPGRTLALLTAVGLLFGVLTCSLDGVFSKRAHADEHEGGSSHQEHSSICFDLFVGTPSGGRSIQRGADPCDYGAKQDLFLAFTPPAAFPGPHEFLVSLEHRGPPVDLQAGSSFTPCGLRAPPKRLSV